MYKKLTWYHAAMARGLRRRAARDRYRRRVLGGELPYSELLGWCDDCGRLGVLDGAASKRVGVWLCGSCAMRYS